MKKRLLLLLSLFTFVYSFAGWTPYTVNYGGKAREYKIYTPNNLAPDAKVVVLLHGLGATMNDFDYSSWPTIADSANIILIAPQKDYSLRSLQLTTPILSIEEVESYLDKILEQDNVKSFFMNTGNI